MNLPNNSIIINFQDILLFIVSHTKLICSHNIKCPKIMKVDVRIIRIKFTYIIGYLNIDKGQNSVDFIWLNHQVCIVAWNTYSFLYQIWFVLIRETMQPLHHFTVLK